MCVGFKKYFFLFFMSGLLSCTAGRDRTSVELIQNMMKQPALKAQRKEGEIGVRTPPEGTYSLNGEHYPYKDSLTKAIKNLKNPYKDRYPLDLILIGKKNYQKACIYCHGAKGDGQGSMKNSMIVLPPSLLTKKARDMTDAQIYHIIHEGQGLMGSYRMQVPEDKKRWALINYIRTLQKAAPL